MSAGESRDSVEDALQKVIRFCERIGAPVPYGPAVILAPTIDGPASGLFERGTRRVRVIFADQAEFEISTRSDTVFAYKNLALRQHLRRRPVEAPITQSEAIKRATEIMEAAGHVGELALEGAWLLERGLPLYADGYYWHVSWNRVFEGIPYRDQHASVDLQGSTGEPISIYVKFSSPPPAVSPRTISREWAVLVARAALLQWTDGNGRAAGIWNETAREAVRGAGVESLAVEVKREVVQPNSFWPSGNLALVFAAEPVARIAWRCGFTCGENIFDFWIDVETGELLGGRASGGPIGDATAAPARPDRRHEVAA